MKGQLPQGWLPAIVAVLLGLIWGLSVAFSHEDGEPYAAYYQGLKTKEGGSCCGGPGSIFHDCEPVDARIGDRGWQAFYHGHWVDVPNDIVNHVANPTGNATLCVHGGAMICFVPGMEM